ncbi:hypothetical protein COT98_01735 [Candidatus Falkowbacteria bacterium CG10_big_fil_rev_8_21_14_0_10_39_9]|uniref:Uncharacterized protein n=1 Tax=Candidatus Falkowbacteria bacterium CG10_big_fil_rev_8_21_14_0_10_39_9 TaxID=1974566 RepID=A0A2M6WQ59_9BACT|nr:MAG: hypothetical protein COT98_01735 [Candidatus Falkowbacteria bacterium CG10_big_fil_rev_8_21_14_0_10_39_9]
MIFIGFGLTPVQAQMNSAPITFTPQVTIPGSKFIANASTTLDNSTAPIAKYISAFYNYGVGIIGILAAMMLMIGGIIWLTAAGSSTKIEQAKSFIGSSLTGMALVLTAFILLKTINPDLVIFKIITVKNLAEIRSSVLDFVGKDALPKDTKIGTACIALNSRCDQIRPNPMISVEDTVCKEKFGEAEWNNRTAACSNKNGWLLCCGESSTDQNTQNDWCAGKIDGTACQVSMTGKPGTGYCQNGKCNACNFTYADEVARRCIKSYECENEIGYCGIQDGNNNGLLNDGGCYNYNVGNYCHRSVAGTDCKNETGNYCGINFCCPGLCCAHTGNFSECIPGAQKGGSGSGSDSPDSCK